MCPERPLTETSGVFLFCSRAEPYRGIVEVMKPSHATVETLSAHILNFETSKASDRIRSALHDAADRIKRVGRSLDCEEGDIAFVKLMVRHRELRRAARSCARMALRLNEDLNASHVEHDALITRILKLEAEIDRLNNRVRTPTNAEIMADTLWARDFLEKRVLHGRAKAFSDHVRTLSAMMSSLRSGHLPAVLDPKELSVSAARFAEQIRALSSDPTLGVTVMLTTATNLIAIATNVEPKALGQAVALWVRQVASGQVIEGEWNNVPQAASAT